MNDDTISRRAAIDALEKKQISGSTLYYTGIRIALKEIKALPSAQPDVPDTNVGDMVSRAAAIDILDAYQVMVENGEENPYAWTRLRMSELPSAQPEIIRCKDCKHKPYPSDNYDYDNGDNGFEIIFPDYRCPCRCEDDYYSRIPDDDWFCGNAERRTDE